MLWYPQGVANNLPSKGVGKTSLSAQGLEKIPSDCSHVFYLNWLSESRTPNVYKELLSLRTNRSHPHISAIGLAHSIPYCLAFGTDTHNNLIQGVMFIKEAS